MRVRVHASMCGARGVGESTGNLDVMSVNIWAHGIYAVRVKDVNGDLFFDKIHANNYPNKQTTALYLSNVSGTANFRSL